MTKLRTLMLAAAASLSLAACATYGPDGETDYGFYLAVTAVGVDLTNDTGVLVAEAGNISDAGMQQILYTSDQVTGSLVQCYGILESVEAGTNTTFNVTGCVVTTLNALESLFDLTNVEGSPFSGQSTAGVIGSLFAMSYPEMSALRDAYQAAQDAGTALPIEVVGEFVQNAVGSNARLDTAVNGG